MSDDTAPDQVEAPETVETEPYDPTDELHARIVRLEAVLLTFIRNTAGEGAEQRARLHLYGE